MPLKSEADQLVPDALTSTEPLDGHSKLLDLKELLETVTS